MRKRNHGLKSDGISTIPRDLSRSEWRQRGLFSHSNFFVDNTMLSLGLSAVLFLGLCISSAVGYGQKILVLGGDGMLGSETVARLKLRGNDITVLHRGTWYWDSSKRIKPWVNFIQCDRDYFNECADKLGDVTREKGMWDAVFDFSGYKSKQIKVNSYLNKLFISRWRVKPSTRKRAS